MEYDCRTCGACCLLTSDDLRHMARNKQDRYPYASIMDHEFRDFVRRYGSEWMRRNTANHHIAAIRSVPRRGPLRRLPVVSCVKLRGSPGHRVSCQIYGNRPEVCRDFEPGGANCRLAIKEMKSMAMGLR